MQYRREVDGLRALAVLPVILFHAGFAMFSGGFVGVDVFFVISGYLITTIILSELEKGRFSIATFYERRARRILPALFFVMAMCIPFAWFWLLPSDMEEFAESLAAVSIFGSNILFARESGYFDTAAELKPLLHTWSLAVEEQFYVLFPLLLMLLWRFGKKWTLTALVLMAAVSLGAAHWNVFGDRAATFFLLPTRAWELALGSFVAFYFANAKSAGEGRHSVLDQMGSGVGFALIAYSIFAFDEATPFPSAYALIPTVGAALILLFAWPQTFIGKLLGSKIAVGIGLISYSAYLWHQPIFAFARHKNLTDPSNALLVGLSIAALALAYLSWKFVEQPFRKVSPSKFLQRRAVFSYALLGSAVFFGMGSALDNTHYFETNLSDEQRRIYAFLEFKDSKDFTVGYRHGVCFYGSRLNSFEHYDKETCLRLEQDKKNYLLIGDSHAAHLWYGLSQNFPDVNVMQATASGCRPLVTVQGEKRCTDLMHYIFEDYIPKHRVDGVILSARWRKEDLEELTRTTKYLEQFTQNIVILGPTIEYTKKLPLLLLRLDASSGDHRKMLDRFTKYERFDFSRDMQEMFAGSVVQYVPVIDGVCPRRQCQAMSDTKEPMAWDYGHFTLSASKLVVKRLKDQSLLRLE